MNTLMLDYFRRHLTTLEKVQATLGEPVVAVARDILTALTEGRKVLIMGNGGSAADAQHFAAELVGRFLQNRRALPAIALTTDTSILTAVGNDFGFDEIFVRQVEALAQPGDVAIGISTSGNSPNVHKALTRAREMGCRTVALLGKGGGSIAGAVDLPLVVPSDETPHIQEAHVTLIHLLCAMVEEEIVKSQDGR